MKPVVAIFAHPDDEVFGPGGTLAILAKERDVYIVCVTDGDAGQNSLADGESKQLAEIRQEELEASAREIGVKQVLFLHYKDGTLSNNLYHEIATKIQSFIETLEPEMLLTLEPRGVSGHLDHIAVSLITTYIFEKVVFVKQLWYFCLSEEARSFQEPYFIYFPPGYKKEEISKVVDITSVWDQKLKAMKNHKSQAHDIEKILVGFHSRDKKECFLILHREDIPTINKE